MSESTFQQPDDTEIGEVKTHYKSIKSRVSIHDRTQVETVFSYGLREKETGNPYYRVDVFLFLPVQSIINPDTYSRSQFYNDLRALIRLREPKFSYKEMIGIKGDDNPLRQMRDCLERETADQISEQAIQTMIEEVRVFGCAYVSYFWKRVDRRVRRIRAIALVEKSANCAALEDALLDLCNKGYGMLHALRDLRGAFRSRLEEGAPELRLEMDLVNEYCTYCFRDGMLRVLTEIQKLDGFEDLLPKGLKKIRTHLRHDRWYARKAGFHWVEDQSDVLAQEDYIYRRGALKRRISSVLYLDPRADFFFNLRKQVGPMIAAGLAAGWALFASILLWNYSNFQGMQILSALSVTSISVIAGIYVFSYVMKDRIKEWMRRVFEKGFTGQRPDLTSNIFFRSRLGKYFKFGVVKEYFTFLKNHKIPEDILALRMVHNDRAIDLEELASSPIHYAKLIKLNTNVLKHLDIPVSAVHDIIRLNIESYLLRLDDPLHRGLALARDQTAVELLMPKVYHLDFVLKYSPLKNAQKSIGVVYDYYRLVVNKRGLLRIEQLK